MTHFYIIAKYSDSESRFDFYIVQCTRFVPTFQKNKSHVATTNLTDEKSIDTTPA